MTSLDYTDIQAGTYFKMNGVVHECLSATFSKKSRQKGSNQVRMKNLKTGATTAKTFHASDKLEKVSLTKEEYVFVYTRNDEVVIHPENNPAERITLPVETLQNIHLIPSGTKVTALEEGGAIITLQPPMKVDLVVKEAPPNIRGNTTQGGTKKVTVETGASITTPLFIETGDHIRINTTTGEYTERITKNR